MGVDRGVSRRADPEPVRESVLPSPGSGQNMVSVAGPAAAVVPKILGLTPDVAFQDQPRKLAVGQDFLGESPRSFLGVVHAPQWGPPSWWWETHPVNCSNSSSHAT